MRRREESRRCRHECLRHVLPLVVAFAGAAFAQAPVALDCGNVVSASLAPISSVFYNFQAQPGDSILLRFAGSSTDTTFLPLVQVLDQGNHALTARPSSTASQTPPGPNPIAAGAKFAGEFDLALGGTYRIQIQNGSQAQGTYNLVYTWLNKPCGQATLACGSAALDQIGAPLQLKSYQFAADAGDIVSVRFGGNGTAKAGFDLTALVYSPGGTLLTTVGGQTAIADISRSGVQHVDIPIAVAGAITIVLFDPANLSGGYALAPVKLKGQCGNGALGCGTVTRGTIGGAWTSNSYSAALQSGDVVTLRYADLDPGSSLAPAVEVYDPQGALVTASSSAISSSPGISATNFTAAATGTFVVIVHDTYVTATGNYAISLLRLNRPCASAQSALGCSARVDGTISGLFGAAIYTVTAAANDQYLLRVLHTDQGSFQPRVDIYDAHGGLFQTIATSTLTRLSFTTPADGVYSVVVSDGYDGSQSGAYTFSLVRLNRPCNPAGTLACGALTAGSFAQPLDAPVYTYNAAAGGSFSVRMLDSTGALQPAVEVYDSQGNLAGQTVTGGYTGVDVAKPAGGVYTVLAMDASIRPAGGPFGVELLQTVNPCASTAAQGQTVAGAITAAQPFVTYSIPVAAGDALLVRSASTTANFSAQMDLYDPAGTRVDSATFALSRRIGTAGAYTVVVGALAARSGGGYSLAWQLLNNPAGAAPLSCGGVTAASLTAAIEFRYYAVPAAAGDVMRLIFNKLSDNFAPQIELFDPTGTRIAQTSDITQKASAAGPYLALVSPSTSSGETGSCGISYQRPNNPCSPAGLTCGQTMLRQVTLPGQMDAFTFAATGGDQADVRLTQRSGAYFPFVELYDGAGNRVTTSSSGSLVFTPAASASYSLLVRDRGGVNPGSYRVSLQDDTNACAVNDTQAPTITLLQPTGGEVIPGGTLFHIAWQSDDNVAVASHDVALSTDGGQTFGAAIAAGLSGNQQSFDWTVPPDIAPSRKAVIRVTATDGAGNAQSAASGLLSIIGSGFTPTGSYSYTYDGSNHLTQAGLGDGRTVQYVWDAAGNLVQVLVTGQ